MADVSAIDTKRPTRMVVVGFLLAAVCAGLVFENLFAEIFAGLRWNDAALVGDWTISSAIGYVLAAALAVGAYFNPRLNKLAYEVASELKKVTWPSAEDTRTSTIAVVLFSIISAALMGGFDFISSKIMTQWIPSALDALTRHI
jgi:preprotein translocase subunit SecE